MGHLYSLAFAYPKLYVMFLSFSICYIFKNVDSEERFEAVMEYILRLIDYQLKYEELVREKEGEDGEE